MFLIPLYVHMQIVVLLSDLSTTETSCHYTGTMEATGTQFVVHDFAQSTNLIFILWHRFIDQPAAESCSEHYWWCRLPAVVWKRVDPKHDVCWLHGRRQRHLFGKMQGDRILHVTQITFTQPVQTSGRFGLGSIWVMIVEQDNTSEQRLREIGPWLRFYSG